MKRLTLLTIAMFTGIVTAFNASADNHGTHSGSDYSSSAVTTAPPPPRPFQVRNADGTMTTVAPTAEGRLQIQQADLPSNTEPRQKVTFLTNSAPRDAKSGYYVGALLGFNIDAYQGSNFTNWFGAGNGLFEGEPRIFNGANSSMSLGPMVAVKFGHVWPFGDPIDQFESETGGLRIGGALEAEFMYIHGFHEYAGAGGNLSNEVQQITFAPMVNALLKGYWGRSEIYGGFGVGVAVTTFDGDGGTAPDDDSFGDFAYQLILGYEFHMNEEWSIFTESKYFTIQDVTYLSTGDSSHVLLGVGVKKAIF
ncbi:MAG: hypothetical protein AAF649_09055 [Verrucomicrobiota bacterium]